MTENMFKEPYEDLYREMHEPSQPRYTIELTTEGWQIKDNELGTIGADAYGTQNAATAVAHCENSNDECEKDVARDRLDALEGEGRR